jgi:hypothetical protein
MKTVAQLKIEHGVPIPPISTRQGNNIRLLQAMKPGDSVFFDKPIEKKAVRLYRVAKKMGIKIAIRKEAGGSRVWRMSGDQPTVTVQTRPAATRRSGKAPKAHVQARSQRSGRSTRPGKRIAQAFAAQ